jgi:hypothetical protein
MKIFPVFCCALLLIGSAMSQAEKPAANLAAEMSVNAEVQERFFAKYPDLADEQEVVSAAARALSAEGAPPGDEASQEEALAVRTRALLAQRTTQEWQRKAVSLFPELGVANSEFNKLFLRHHSELQRTSPEFMQEPSWPVLLAKRCADELRAPPPVAATLGAPARADANPPQGTPTTPATAAHRTGFWMTLVSIVLLLAIIVLPARWLFRCSRAFAGNSAPLTAWQRALRPATWAYLGVAVSAVLRTYFANADQPIIDRFGITLLVGLLTGAAIALPVFFLALGVMWWLRPRANWSADATEKGSRAMDASGRKA